MFGISLGILTKKRPSSSPPIGAVHIRYVPAGITGSGSGWTDSGTPGGYDQATREGSPTEEAALLDGNSGITNTSADALQSTYAQSDTQLTLLMVAKLDGDPGGFGGMIGTNTADAGPGWCLAAAGTDFYCEVWTLTNSPAVLFQLASDSGWHVFCLQIRANGDCYGGIDGLSFIGNNPVLPSSTPLTLGDPNIVNHTQGATNCPVSYVQIDYWNDGSVDAATELAILQATYPSLP